MSANIPISNGYYFTDMRAHHASTKICLDSTPNMKNPRILVSIALALILLPAVLIVLVPSGPAGSPNIIFILTDDQDVRSTRHMKRVIRDLVQEELYFNKFFVTNPLCCPSRVSFLRGQYMNNHGCDGYRECFDRFRQQQFDKLTIATVLQHKGYFTGLIGKYLNGDGSSSPEGRKYIPPGWDEWHGLITPGSNHWKFTINHHGTIKDYDGEFQTGVLKRLALDFLQAAKNRGAPFFLYLAPFAPHGPLTPAPRHKNIRHKIKNLRRYPSFNEKDVSDKPKWLQKRSKINLKNRNIIIRRYRETLRLLMAVDEMVGEIVDFLKANDILDNTYIIFASDNGFHRGEHRIKKGKQTPYEESINVPMVIRGPGVAKGRTTDHLVINNDIFPTILDWVNAPVPDFVDGRSITPLMQLKEFPKSKWRQSFMVEHIIPKDIRKPWWVPNYRGFRTRRLKYVEYETGEYELYDLENDSFEMNNLYSRASNQLRRALRLHLEKLKSCLGKSCRTTEDLPFNAPLPLPQGLIR